MRGKRFKKIIKKYMAIALVFSSLFVATACGKDDGKDQSLTKAELSALYKEVALETWESLGGSDPTVSTMHN